MTSPNKDDPLINGWHLSTHNCNGDYQEWIDHQGCISRDLSDTRGIGDPDPKYDLAPFLTRLRSNRKKSMVNLRQHLSQFLKSSDFDKPVCWTLSGEFREEKMPDEKLKPVVYFREDTRGLVLNQINGEKLIEIAGTADTTEMAGVKVVLFRDQCPMGGKVVDCIRLRAPKEQQQSAPEESAPEEIPF